MSCKTYSGLRRWWMILVILLALSSKVGLVESVPSAPVKIAPSGLTETVKATSLADSIIMALNWLTGHQLSNGSYGTCTELETAPAAYALWIAYRDSTNVVSALNWLKNQMDNSTTWFWVGGGCSFGEADVPGEILYSFDLTNHLAMLNLSFVSSKLLSFQQGNGGFTGYYDTSLGRQVTSSVDTAMALWGLVDAKAISASKEQSAITYLLSLQNHDGSFNLTSTVVSDQLYSLGPEKISITALALLVLKDASFNLTDPHATSALAYLTNAASMNFTGHVYAASLSDLLFTSLNLSSYVSEATNFIISQQNPDGGFRDIIRTSTGSNPLDTGWATVAMQLGRSACTGCTVGGFIVPIDKVALLAAFIGLAVLVLGPLVAVVVFAKHSKDARRRIEPEISAHHIF